MKRPDHHEGIIPRRHVNGTLVYSAVITKQTLHFDRRFPTREEAVAFRREDKLKDALWQFPSISLSQRAGLRRLCKQDPLIAPILKLLLRCSPGSGAPPLGPADRNPHPVSPPGRPHSQRPMDPPPPSDITMNDYARRWFEENRWRWKGTSAYEVKSLLLVRIMPAWRHRAVRTLTDPLELKAWLLGLAQTGLSPTHVKNIRACLVTLLHAAQVDGLIPANPMQHPDCSRNAILTLIAKGDPSHA